MDALRIIGNNSKIILVIFFRSITSIGCIITSDHLIDSNQSHFDP